MVALRSDASPLPGWPVHYEPPLTTGGVNTADLDGDAQPEVAFSHGKNLYILEHDGSLRPGWPFTADSNLRDSAALGDLDGDGRLEVAAVEEAGLVHGLDAGGKPRPGWPQPVPAGSALAAPSLVDLDGGGRDVVVPTDGAGVFAFHADGSAVPGWPSTGALRVPRAGAAADLDGDGSPEIVQLTYDGEIVVLDAHGTTRARTRRLFDFAISSPAVGDLNGDGKPEIVAGGDFTTFDGALYAFSADGKVLPGWPVRTGGWVRTSPAIVDLDGDGAAEVIAGSIDGWLHALRADGRELPGWPYFLGGISSDNLALGDLDGDGTLEMASTVYRPITFGFAPIVTVLEFGSVSPGALPWPSGRGGPGNPGAAAPP
jgi:hypothetical protein